MKANKFSNYQKVVQRFGGYKRNRYLCTIICVTIKFKSMENIIKNDELRASIQSKIYVIRGQRVMLDFDLAAMYGVKTKVLNQSVKRNIERFPEDFMFQLTKGEYEILTNEDLRLQIVIANDEDDKGDSNLRSQIVTSRFIDNWGGSRRMPYAFTENGVAMLSSVLRSPLAIIVRSLSSLSEPRRIFSTSASSGDADCPREYSQTRR